MTASVLVHGVIFKTPERKISSRGHEYVCATIREGNGDISRWWRVSAFNDAAVELLKLEDGDAVSVSGAFEASIYEKSGAARIGFSVLASKVISLRPQPKEKRVLTKPAAPRKAAAPDCLGSSPDADLNDQIPF